MSAVLAGGLALGAVYAMVGVGVTIVALAARTLLLAVGAILVTGVLTDLVLSVEVVTGLPAVAAVLLALATGAALTALLEPLVLGPFRDPMLRLTGVVVAAVVIEAIAARVLGTRTLRPDALVPLPPWAGVNGEVWTALLIGVPATVLLAVAVRHTRWGRRLRVVGGSVVAAERAGIPPRWTRTGALAVAGAVAVGAGLLAAPITFVQVGQGAALTVRGVAAGLLFGHRGPLWALPAGLLIGLAEAAGQSLHPSVGGELAVAGAVVAILVIRGPELSRAWGRAW